MSLVALRHLAEYLAVRIAMSLILAVRIETCHAVCRGLACMLRGAYELIEHCEAKLGVKCGHTTEDGAVTLEFAECIGACDGAPACLRDDVHVMNVTTEKADALIQELKVK